MSLENSGARKQQIEASYLAGNLSWNADYILTVGREDKAADLDGWVTLANTSGTAFHNARLQLVAGELNRLPVGRRWRSGLVMVGVAKAAAPQFQQENFSEYHLYTLGRRTSIEDKETKQISLLQGTGVPTEKVFIVNGQNYYYHNAQNPGSPQKDPVMVYYKFKNEEKAGLGMPLPAGNVRVYQKDSKGGVLFIGEDRIDHTPKDETVTVHIGNAFDIVEERKQTDYKRIDSHTWEMEFEIQAAQSQGLADSGGSERADWRRLGDAVVNLQGYEDGGVRGAVSCAGGEGWDFGAEVSHSGTLVKAYNACVAKEFQHYFRMK